MLHLLAPGSPQLLLRADHGLPPLRAEGGGTLPVGLGVVGEVAASGVAQRVEDVAGTEKLQLTGRSAAGIRSLVCAPVRSRETILGTLSLGRRTGSPFTEEETALLACVADQLGVALEHARASAESRRQNEELERAQNVVVKAERLSAVGELTRGVAHEINNPLTIILGHVQVLLGESPGEEMSQGLVAIERAARRAAGVVRDLRLFAEPVSSPRRPCLLSDHVERALALEQPRLSAQSVEGRMELEEAPPVWPDAGQLDQLLHHLVDNALHAMAAAAGGTLTICVRPCDGGVRLEVIDDGPGIAPDHLPRIFNPFFSTKPPHEGRGLGLSMAHGIVREHGGRIWAENGPHRGARFIVELPLGLRRTEAARPD